MSNVSCYMFFSNKHSTVLFVDYVWCEYPDHSFDSKSSCIANVAKISPL